MAEALQRRCPMLPPQPGSTIELSEIIDAASVASVEQLLLSLAPQLTSARELSEVIDAASVASVEQLLGVPSRCRSGTS